MLGAGKEGNHGEKEEERKGDRERCRDGVKGAGKNEKRR